MCDGPWYNPAICSQLHGHSFENLFNTGIKDRYYLMYAIGA